MLPIVALGAVVFLLLNRQQPKKQGKGNDSKDGAPSAAVDLGKLAGGASAVAGAIGGVKASLASLGGGSGAASAAKVAAPTIAKTASVTLNPSPSNLLGAIAALPTGFLVVLSAWVIIAIVAKILSSAIQGGRDFTEKLARVATNPVRRMLQFEFELLTRVLSDLKIPYTVTEAAPDAALYDYYRATGNYSESYKDTSFVRPIVVCPTLTSSEKEMLAYAVRNASYAYATHLAELSAGVWDSFVYNAKGVIQPSTRNIEDSYRSQIGFPDSEVPDYNSTWWAAKDIYMYPGVLESYQYGSFASKYQENAWCAAARTTALQIVLTLLKYDTFLYLPWDENTYRLKVYSALTQYASKYNLYLPGAQESKQFARYIRTSGGLYALPVTNYDVVSYKEGAPNAVEVQP